MVPEPRPIVPGSAATPTLAKYLDEVFLLVVKRDKAPRTHEAAERAANQLKPILGTQ